MFYFFLNEYRKIGTFILHPVQSRIALMVEVRFSGVNYVGKDFIKGTLWLKEKLFSEKFIRHEFIPPDNHLHYFKIADEFFIDDEFRRYMKMAYDIGCRKHIRENITKNKPVMTKDKIVFVHWNKEEADTLSAPLKEKGFDLFIEHGEGKLTTRKDDAPKAVIISLQRLPSHGYRIAEAYRYTKWGKPIPLIFFDGEKEKVENIRKRMPGEIFTTHKNLVKHLKNILK